MSGETFEKLLTPHLRFVRTLVYTRVKATGHAEDIIQETLLRAYTRRDQLRAEGNFKAMDLVYRAQYHPGALPARPRISVAG
jgi:DNA-directed RNA polymerase specialized sigma24 family protein